MNNIELKPKGVFEEFAKINAIPRPSKHEEKMIDYLVNFGKEHGLDTHKDEVGNVIIRKGATPGYENLETVILQCHMDMVCDKLVDVDIDFFNDPIQTYVDGEWLKAKGTTLGADDGIGDAMCLALLKSDDIEHGPIECVFTRDEETGLTGANGMKSDFMTGKYLINLDSEDEGQIFCSCAGGKTTTGTFKFTREDAPSNFFFMKATIKGLLGGHSGDDIDKKHANAIKFFARFLYMEQEKMTVRLASFCSGTKHNAIPRDGEVIFAVPEDRKEEVKADWNIFAANAQDEFCVTEPNMQFNLGSCAAQSVIPLSTSTSLIRCLQAMPNGILAMSQQDEIAWLVETSSNLASVQTTENEVVCVASQRSSVMSNLENMCNTIHALFQLAGATEIIHNDGYPAWKMNKDSKILKITVDTYKKLFNKEPMVRGIHAGLECGLFAERYPDLDMVSLGPTLRGVHTPDEKLLIPTVDMVWRHLLEILKNIPSKS